MLAIIFFIVIPLVLFFYFKYNIGSIIVTLFLLFIFYYTPYSFYLEPSYWKFRNMCKLNELPNDEEKYNKILRYFDTDLDNMSNVQTLRVSDDKKYFSYWFEKWIGDRIKIIFVIYFKSDMPTKNNIKKIYFSSWWHDLRPLPAGNEGTGFYLSEDRKSCDYFKKELNE